MPLDKCIQQQKDKIDRSHQIIYDNLLGKIHIAIVRHSRRNPDEIVWFHSDHGKYQLYAYPKDVDIHNDYKSNYCVSHGIVDAFRNCHAEFGYKAIPVCNIKACNGEIIEEHISR